MISSTKARESLAIGADVGGSRLRAGLVDRHGRVRSDVVDLDLPDRKPLKVIQMLADSAERLRDKAEAEDCEVLGIGLGIAGWVARESGRVLVAPNLGWKGYPAATKLEELTDLRVTLANDVESACYGEWISGAAKGNDNVITVFVGTGIGAAAILAGKPYRGARGVGGEIGHIKIPECDRKCTCGDKGCMEAYLGGKAISDRATAALEQPPAPNKKHSPILLECKAAGQITYSDLDRARTKKDTLAAKLLLESASILAREIGNLAVFLEPEVVVLGGGAVENSATFRRDLTDLIRKGGGPNIRGRLKVRKALLGDKAGMIGAACLAFAEIDGKAKTPA